jgi:flagellin-specific chaperone FliS
MSSQLLVGGVEIQDTPAFKQALRQEQDRIRKAYNAKVAELEKEREAMEEEKTQSSRYKQLLLKQRDIMIQLTARLNERDQSVWYHHIIAHISPIHVLK